MSCVCMFEWLFHTIMLSSCVLVEEELLQYYLLSQLAGN